MLVRKLEAYLFHFFDTLQNCSCHLVGEMLDGLALQLGEDAQDSLLYRLVDPNMLDARWGNFPLRRDAGGEYTVSRLR